MPDKYMMLSEAQTLVHAAGSWDTTNAFNTKIVASDLGAGRALVAKAQIRVTFLAAAGAANFGMKLQHAPDDGAGAPGAWEDLPINSGQIAKATLVAGYVLLNVALPKHTHQWLKGVLTIDTNPGTAGALDAWFDIE